MNDKKTSQAQMDFIRRHIREKKIITAYQILLFVLFTGLWELATYYEWMDPFVFSSPSRVVRTFINMLFEGTLAYHIWVTLYETLVSFILGSVLGLIVAVFLWWWDKAAKTLEPYLIILNSMPKTALAPIIIVWLGNNAKSIIFTALMSSVIVTIINIYSGFIQVDLEKIKLIKTFGGTKRHILSKVIIPANYANLISTLKINIGLCLIGVIIGEFLVAKAGLGYLIVYGSQIFKLDWVMMSIIILALLATLLYKITIFIEKKVK